MKMLPVHVGSAFVAICSFDWLFLAFYFVSLSNSPAFKSILVQRPRSFSLHQDSRPLGRFNIDSTRDSRTSRRQILEIKKSCQNLIKQTIKESKQIIILVIPLEHRTQTLTLNKMLKTACYK